MRFQAVGTLVSPIEGLKHGGDQVTESGHGSIRRNACKPDRGIETVSKSGEVRLSV